MKTIMRTLAVAALVITAVGSTYGQDYLPAVYVDVTEIQGLTPEGGLPLGGTDLVFPVRFKNIDVSRTVISNGYRFVGTDVTWDNLTVAWNPAYPWDWPMAIALGQYPPFFDQGTYINYFDENRLAAPTTEAVGVGLAGLATPSGLGLPATFDGIAYFITLTNVTAQPGAFLTMDSTWWQPANYWLWSGVGSGVSWGGPYTLQTYTPPPPLDVWCTPQPTILHESDPLIEFHVRCWTVGVNCDEINLQSVRIAGKIPPYEGYPVIEDGVLTTACLLTRFLGASGFRPIPPEGVQSTFTLDFDTYDGNHYNLTGDYVLEVLPADVTFDGQVNIDDIVLLSDYLFNGGPKARLFGEDMDEFMDVDGSGQFDLLDIQAAIAIAGL